MEPFAAPDEIEMQTSTGEVQAYTRYGHFQFTVDGQLAELTVYESDGGYFLPFVDGLTPKETYGAGRYLEPEPLGSDRFAVDFNLAYNPLLRLQRTLVLPADPL